MSARAIGLATIASIALTLGGCGGFEDPGPIKWHAGDANPRVLRDGPRLQCVPYARDASGVRIWGDAYTWWGKAAGKFDRAYEPEPGAVMVFKGYNNDQRGHLAVVRRVINEREVIVDHANWLNTGEINLDNPVMDVSDDNDWSEVRVWYAPGNHYGGRIYKIQGFILGPSGEARVAER